MDGMDWKEFILQLGAMSAAVTGVGRLLIGLYKKYVTDPYNNLSEKMQKENAQSLKDSIDPLNRSIKHLNYLLEDSQADRKVLHKKDEAQDVIMDNHEVRITVLEDWRKDHTHKKGENR